MQEMKTKVTEVEAVKIGKKTEIEFKRQKNCLVNRVSTMKGKGKIDYQKVHEFWNETAKNSIYEEDFQTGMRIPNRLAAQYRKYKEEEHFDKIISLRKDTNVLEIGCGTGRWAFYMAPKVKKVVAIDISENMIEIAKNTLEKRHITNINLYCCSALDFDTKNNEKFDLLYFSSVLQYISDDDVKAILNKVPKWLNDDGICLSRDSVSLKQRLEFTEEYPLINRTQEEYIKLFEECGLYLIYNKESYKRILVLEVCSAFLNRFFPKSNLRALVILERLVRPLEIFLWIIYALGAVKEIGLKNVVKEIREIGLKNVAARNKTSHEFFVYKLKGGIRDE